MATWLKMTYVLTRPSNLNEDHSYSISSGCIKPNESYPEHMRRFNEIICDFLREHGVPGAAFALNLHGKPIYRQGYGISRSGEPVSSSSYFRIASISKVITAVAILRLCAENKIRLHDNVFGVGGILSELLDAQALSPIPLTGITIKHLLQHSAGWDRDREGDHVFWYQQFEHSNHIDAWNIERLVKYVLSKGLSFKPGSKHAYSNFGYLLLGLIIEKVTGMMYEDYTRSILHGFGIDNIFVGKTDQSCVDYREVKYYNNKDPPIEKSVFDPQCFVTPQYGSFPMENSGAYGGWVACTTDLLALLNGLSEKIISEGTDTYLMLMLKKPRFFSSEETWYGLGIDVEDNGSSYGHTGAMEGSSTIVHQNKDGLSWALLLNSWAKDMDLNGLIKYAFASVCKLQLWKGPNDRLDMGEYFIMAQDERECVRLLLPYNEVLSHITDMKNIGFKISWISAISLSYDVLFNIVWRKNWAKKDWSVIMDVALDEFNNCLQKLKGNWSITMLELYHMKGKVYHLLVFEEGIREQKIYVVDDAEKHKKFSRVYFQQGFQQMTQCVLSIGHQLIVACIFEKKKLCKESQVWIDLPIEKFMDLLSDYISNSYNLEYMQFYSSQDMPKISAVWTKKKAQMHNVFQRHDVTKYGLLYELRESMQDNRPVAFISSYEHEGVVYFATFWETYLRKPHTIKDMVYQL